MKRHVWINPTNIDVSFGQVAWQKNVPSDAILLGYYATCFTKTLTAQQKNMVYRKIPILFNDAFGGVWYAQEKLMLGSLSTDGNILVYYTGDQFPQPITVKEGMGSIALTTILPDLVQDFALTGTTHDGTYFNLGTALLVEVD